MSKIELHRGRDRSARVRTRLRHVLALLAWTCCSLGHEVALAGLTTTSEQTWLSALADPTVRVNFDELPDGTQVTTGYAGVIFSPFNGGAVPVAAAENFPHSPANVLSVDNTQLGQGGGVSLDFAVGRSGVGFWYSDAQFVGNTVGIYAASNQLLGQFELVYPHPTEWQFVGFTSSLADIARIDIAMASNDRVTFDDFQFTTPVPEPAIWVLAMAGICLLATRRAASKLGPEVCGSGLLRRLSAAGPIQRFRATRKCHHGSACVSDSTSPLRAGA